ncbi:MAG: glycosyltransferase [Deltaproteobacteria bacterium]|nr:glycosyltransferase [Deltaproteobacteria bacterium]
MAPQQSGPQGQPLRLVLTGGGTSGHVNPALAMAQAFQRQAGGAKIDYIGIRGRAEEVIVPEAGLPLHFVTSAPFCSPKRPLGFARFALRLAFGCLTAGGMLLRLRPDYVLATGGYAAAPVVLAQTALRSLGLSRAKIILHEANASPGKLNRLMASRADHLFLTFGLDQANAANGREGVVVGYPVRQSLERLDRQEALARLGLDLPPGVRVVLVFGGSQGARSINQAIIKALAPLSQAPTPLFILHATGLGGKNHHPWKECQDLTDRLYGPDWTAKLAHLYRLVPYLHDMSAAYSAADLVVCRAGAGTIHEISSLGKAALLIPKPNLPADHQVVNARTMVACGGAELLYEDLLTDGGRIMAGLDGQTLAESIMDLIAQPERIEELSRASQAFLPQGAAGRIARMVLQPGEETPASMPNNVLPPPPTHQGLLTLLSRAYRAGPQNYDPTRLVPDPDELTYYRRRSALLLLEPAWPTRNLGVKLVGFLKDESKIDHLVLILSDRTPVGPFKRLFGGDFVQVGFIRRNALTSLMIIDRLTPQLEEALKKALVDPYYEVRTKAAQATAHFAGRLAQPAAFEDLLRERLADRSFEVVCAAAGALGCIGRDESAVSALLALKRHRLWPVRQASLTALKELVRRGVVIDRERLIQEVTGFVTTATDFRPHFSIKAAYQELLDLLEKEER